MVRAPTSKLIDLHLISLSKHNKRVKKMLFTATLLDAQQKGDSAEKKPANSQVVILGKKLSDIPPFL